MFFYPKKRLVVLQLAIFLVLLLPIIGVLATRYIPNKGFTDLMMFGTLFEETRLPEINQFDPPTFREWGNDGQLYVQLALDPFLTRSEELEDAIPRPLYRARRIGLPLIAYVFGLGNPLLIIHAYSVLNVAFWLLLLVLLWKKVGLFSFRSALLFFSLLWSAGTITSVSRAVPDLPAFVMVLTAIWIDSYSFLPAVIFSYAILIKETSILGILGVVLKNNNKVINKASNLVIILAPILIWIIFSNLRLNGNQTGTQVLALPLKSYGEKVILSFEKLIKALSNPAPWPSYRLFCFFDFISPISLLLQTIYFFLYPRLKSIEWKTGIGFAALFFFLGDSVWADLYAYSRVLIPLTFCFNILIYTYEKGKLFTLWFILGNIGMLWGIIEILYNVFG